MLSASCHELLHPVQQKQELMQKLNRKLTLLPMWVVMHFDGIGHKNCITPLDLSVAVHWEDLEELKGDLRTFMTKPKPVLMFVGQDNEIMNHLIDPMLDLNHSIRRTNPTDRDCDLIHLNSRICFCFDLSRVLLKSDGAPRNKITGFKGGGHVLRFTFNKQSGRWTAHVLVQNEEFVFTVQQCWDLYDKQQKEERGKSKKEIIRYVSALSFLKLYISCMFACQQ